jgi:hypothetical protein
MSTSLTTSLTTKKAFLASLVAVPAMAVISLVIVGVSSSLGPAEKAVGWWSSCVPPSSSAFSSAACW